MSLLSTEGLRKRFGSREVVKGVSLEVGEAEIVGLLGRNGAGKTTTFKMIMGLLRPNAGTVRFNGEVITKLPMYQRARRHIGYLAQEPSVFQRLSAEENLLAVLELQKGLSPARRQELTQARLREMGLETVRHSLAAHLSGGERRKLEIARALAIEPRLMLLDEPFYGVDPIGKGEIRRIIADFKRRRISVLITDHDAREILTVAERTYIMSEGEIWLEGKSRQLVDHPLAREKYLGPDFYIEWADEAGEKKADEQ